ncbi:phosphotransferase family protein [Antribacter gilvus]|uniref:phosphotransferase family protein n=1 Tax=Antribacter gilvus TaxID=2304675 RepID=UPI000F7BA57D|nr:aminoglycoside phosphotransferase family protein [Antribacter gilvus]
MRSPTQQDLQPEQVSRLVRDTVGAEPVRCTELAGGGFAAVWRVDLAEPVAVPGAEPSSALVLKAGPPPGTPLLTYEADLSTAEGEYLDLVAAGAPEVPVPRVVARGSAADGAPDGLGTDWLLTSFLPGTSLTDLPADAAGPVRRDVGAALAAVHRISGDRFGYSGARPHGATWGAAFAAILGALLSDAEAWGLPPAHVEEGRVRAALDRHGPVLDAVDRPALLHFDLWDGNVLVLPGGRGEGQRMSGLVDGERYLFGDPLVDLVSPVLFGRIEDVPDHPVLRGYAEAAGVPPVLDASARTRLGLYRVWLYVLMLAEMPSRGMDGPEHDGRREHVARLLDEELTRLGA